MSSGPPASSRSALLDEVLARLSGRRPRVTVLSGPRGWGKEELLDNVSRRLANAGIHPVEIDASRCAVHPGEFACTVAVRCLETALGVVPDAGSAGSIPPEARLRSLAEGVSLEPLGTHAGACVREILEGLRVRPSPGGSLVRAALDLPGHLAGAAGGPVVLVARSLDQISRLTPFPGLRGVERMVAAALRPAILRVAASVSPEGRPGALIAALREELGEEMDELAVPPLDTREVTALCDDVAEQDRRDQAAMILRLTGGRLLTSRILARGLSPGLGVEESLRAGMEPGEGRLHQELRFDYHLLIERTRGHAACRAALNVLAREEGLDLTGVASRMRRSPGSTLDYLRWLMEVGLIRREGRRYVFTDPLQRLHVLLDQVPERPGDAPGRAAVIRGFLRELESPRMALRPLGRPPGSGKGRARRPPARPPSAPRQAPPDELMEID